MLGKDLVGQDVGDLVDGEVVSLMESGVNIERRGGMGMRAKRERLDDKKRQRVENEE